MKILYHHRTHSRDGQSVHIDGLIDALRARRHEVSVVAPAAAESAEFGNDRGLVSALKRRLPRVTYEALEAAYGAHAALRLLAAARAFCPDVIYERANVFMPGAVWISDFCRVPLLLEVNAPLAAERARHSGGLALRRIAEWTERTSWRGADAVLPVTHVLAAELIDAGVLPDRIEVLPNGVDASFLRAVDRAAGRRRFGLSEGDVALGFTGFVRDWHGLDRVIDLVAEVRQEVQLRLVIVGEGPAIPQLRKRAVERGVGSLIVFAGLVPRAEMPEAVAAFDIALQPKVVPYASPLKIFEYMALGRAIVAPDQPNIREILMDGTTALLVGDDPAAFRTAVMRLATDAGLRGRIGAGARSELHARGFTWARNAERIEAIARRLCASTPGAAQHQPSGQRENRVPGRGTPL